MLPSATAQPAAAGPPAPQNRTHATFAGLCGLGGGGRGSNCALARLLVGVFELRSNSHGAGLCIGCSPLNASTLAVTEGGVPEGRGFGLPSTGSGTTWQGFRLSLLASICSMTTADVGRENGTDIALQLGNLGGVCQAFRSTPVIRYLVWRIHYDTQRLVSVQVSQNHCTEGEIKTLSLCNNLAISRSNLGHHTVEKYIIYLKYLIIFRNLKFGWHSWTCCMVQYHTDPSLCVTACNLQF